MNQLLILVHGVGTGSGEPFGGLTRQMAVAGTMRTLGYDWHQRVESPHPDAGEASALAGEQVQGLLRGMFGCGLRGMSPAIAVAWWLGVALTVGSAVPAWFGVGGILITESSKAGWNAPLVVLRRLVFAVLCPLTALVVVFSRHWLWSSITLVGALVLGLWAPRAWAGTGMAPRMDGEILVVGLEQDEFWWSLLVPVPAVVVGLVLAYAIVRALRPVFAKLETPLKLAADVTRYLGDAHYRASVRGGLVDLLAAGLAQHPGEVRVVVVGHSLGSVIAVDALLTLPSPSPASAGRLLVTMGSPLELLLARFFAGWWPPPTELLERGRRARRIDAWLNVHRKRDPIGRALRLPATPYAEDRCIEPRLGWFAAHVGYFDSDVVKAEIERWSRLPVAQPAAGQMAEAEAEVGGLSPQSSEAPVMASLLASAFAGLGVALLLSGLLVGNALRADRGGEARALLRGDRAHDSVSARIYLVPDEVRRGRLIVDEQRAFAAFLEPRTAERRVVEVNHRMHRFPEGSGETGEFRTARGERMRVPVLSTTVRLSRDEPGLVVAPEYGWLDEGSAAEAASRVAVIVFLVAVSLALGMASALGVAFALGLWSGIWRPGAQRERLVLATKRMLEGCRGAAACLRRRMA